MWRQRSAKIAALIVAGVAAYTVAVFSLDFLRVDRCLDLGGSWDRNAEVCLLDGSSIRSAYPTWVFGLCGAMSIIVFTATCVSFIAACLRRWEFARFLSGRSCIAGIGILVVTFVLATTAVTSGESGPESKATRLAKTISELMNATVGIYPAVPMSGATWTVATVALWLRRRGLDRAAAARSDWR
jgi:hypothetical protein